MSKDYSYLLHEKEKWQARKKEIEDELAGILDEERRLRGELQKMREQVGYYDSLTRDMKREMQPPGVSSMLKSI